MVLERTRGGDREVGSGLHQMNTHEKMKMTRVNGRGGASLNLHCHFLDQTQVVALHACTPRVKGDSQLSVLAKARSGALRMERKVVAPVRIEFFLTALHARGGASGARASWGGEELTSHIIMAAKTHGVEQNGTLFKNE